VSVNGQDNHGITSNADYASIINTGLVSVDSGTGQATAINLWYCVGGEVTNIGTIIANGSTSLSSYAYGVYLGNSQSSINNQGTINSNARNGIGIYTDNNNININNSGKIIASGQYGYGIRLNAPSNSLTNTGLISATGVNSSAIFISGLASNNTVNLNRGSVIIGDIHGDAGAKLNINLGAGASYAYSTTGTWAVTDLDNRPMVTGSAYAAGIGAQETASEMLYQRTSSITSALDRRLRAYASDEVDSQPYWLDVYYSDVSRNSGGNYSTQTAFSNHNYGITAGFKLPTQLTPLELVVNVEQSNLNIDSGNQKIDSSSIMTGLLAPNIIDVLGAKLSAKALVGYADHDGDRKVMTNSLLYNGSRQIKSDYNSTYAVLGTALTKLYPITDRLTADVILGIDLNTQRFESYKESDYFAWDSRTLTQLHSRVQTGLDYKLWGDKGSVFARVGAEHRDLIGGATQDYSINGTNVSFNTNNKNDTYLTAQIGVRAQLEKRVHLFGVVNTLHSSDSVNSVSGNIGLRADF
jgi:hypothetical protein